MKRNLEDPCSHSATVREIATRAGVRINPRAFNALVENLAQYVAEQCEEARLHATAKRIHPTPLRHMTMSVETPVPENTKPISQSVSILQHDPLRP